MSERQMEEGIEKALAEGRDNFAIYPYGVQGKIFKRILNKKFGIKEELIIDNIGNDNGECDVKRFEDIERTFFSKSTVFLVSDHSELYYELRSQILKYVPKENIIDVLAKKGKSINELYPVLAGRGGKVLFNPMFGLRGSRIQEVGGNTGNLVFVEAIKEQLDFDIETGMTNEWVKTKLGRSNISSIMPASNFVGRHFGWGDGEISILEKTDMRFTFVGLGVQAAFNETPKDVVSKMTEKQKYIFKLVGERAAQIGVRGEFTAQCLEEMGVTNVEVIGCPSFYQYKEQYPVLKFPLLDKVLYTADSSKNKIFTLSDQMDSYFIRQTYGDGEEDSPIFFDFKKWNNYISNGGFTFAFGSRFHGNMMALRNKIPTLWIVHDWRTLELVQCLGLPYLNYFDSKFQKIKYAEELLEYCDYSRVYQRYSKLYNNYCDFIRKNFDERF